METLKAIARKHDTKTYPVFTGRVEVYHNQKYLYSHSTGIQRLTKQDALLDANTLIKDLTHAI